MSSAWTASKVGAARRASFDEPEALAQLVAAVDDDGVRHGSMSRDSRRGPSGTYPTAVRLAFNARARHGGRLPPSSRGNLSPQSARIVSDDYALWEGSYGRSSALG